MFLLDGYNNDVAGCTRSDFVVDTMEEDEPRRPVPSRASHPTLPGEPEHEHGWHGGGV